MSSGLFTSASGHQTKHDYGRSFVETVGAPLEIIGKVDHLCAGNVLDMGDLCSTLSLFIDAMGRLFF